MPEFMVLYGDTKIDITEKIKKSKGKKELKEALKAGLKAAVEKEKGKAECPSSRKTNQLGKRLTP